MAKKYEYFNTGDDLYGQMHADAWYGQTFTPLTTHKISKVKLLLYKVGNPGTVTVSIRTTDGDGKPTGSDLTSGTFDGTDLTADTAGEWKEIEFDEAYKLKSGTKYAIVVRESANLISYLCWRVNTGGTYTRGECVRSADGGSTWALPGGDFMFEEWGNPLYLGNPNVDQLYFQHAERMERFR